MANKGIGKIRLQNKGSVKFLMAYKKFALQRIRDVWDRNESFAQKVKYTYPFCD